MATPTLVATAGSASANSYVTLAEANDFHDARLHATDWTGATDAVKTVALIMATRTLDAMMIWNRHPTTLTQALQWPRNGMMKRSGLEFVLDTVIPQELKDATAELARQLIVEDRTLDSDVETQGISSLSAGSVAISFRSDVKAKVIPDAVVGLLVPDWGYVRGRAKTARLGRA